MSKQKHFILLRGLTRESRHWGDFPDLFKKEYPHSEMTLLDLPGAGTLHKEKAPLTVHEMTLRLRDEIKKDSLEKKNITFIGVSLGGMVAMKWAELFPQDLDNIILINSSAGNIVPFWKRLKPAAASTLIHSLLNPKNQHGIIFDRVCRKKENREQLIELWDRIHKENPVSLENTSRQIFAAARFKLNKEIKVPGLVLAAMGDDLVSHECSEMIAHHLNYPLEMHPWAGHELPDDDPDWVIKKITSFVN